MSTKCFAQVRGSVIRVTQLDACGNPDAGNALVVVSKRVSAVKLEPDYDKGTNIRERNFADELCVVDTSFDQLIGYKTKVTLCGVDPALISLMTGQPTVTNANGDIVGFDVNTHVNLDSFGFSLEIWSRIAGSACDTNDRRPWGYTVVPFLKGGTLSGFTFENKAASFEIDNALTRDGNGWGVGPYAVDRNVAGLPVPLATPLSVNTHFRNMLVYLDPPLDACGALNLASH